MCRNPSSRATSLAVVLLPAAAGPSIAMTISGRGHAPQLGPVLRERHRDAPGIIELDLVSRKRSQNAKRHRDTMIRMRVHATLEGAFLSAHHESIGKLVGLRANRT